MQVYVMYAGHVAAYTGDSSERIRQMASFSSSLFSLLGPAQAGSSLLALSAAVEGFGFIKLFLDQIFLAVLVLLVVIGVLVIYSLLLGDTEARVYEYGMLRALGLRGRTLAQLLFTQSLFFALPGVLSGILAGHLLGHIVADFFSSYSGLLVPPGVAGPSVALAVALGIVMPFAANVGPVRRSLSKTLRDALDLYHQSAAEVVVRMQRLAEVGLSAPQIGLSVVLVVAGFTTFYVIPLSFVFQRFDIFLAILTCILLGMLSGLSLVSQTVQPLCERLALATLVAAWRALCACAVTTARLCGLASAAAKLFPANSSYTRTVHTIALKNLTGHRNRNRKTAYLLSISTSFLIFAGTMFALQVRTDVLPAIQSSAISPVSPLADSAVLLSTPLACFRCCAWGWCFGGRRERRCPQI